MRPLPKSRAMPPMLNGGNALPKLPRLANTGQSMFKPEWWGLKEHWRGLQLQGLQLFCVKLASAGHNYCFLGLGNPHATRFLYDFGRQPDAKTQRGSADEAKADRGCTVCIQAESVQEQASRSFFQSVWTASLAEVLHFLENLEKVAFDTTSWLETPLSKKCGRPSGVDAPSFHQSQASGVRSNNVTMFMAPQL